MEEKENNQQREQQLNKKLNKELEEQSSVFKNLEADIKSLMAPLSKIPTFDMIPAVPAITRIPKHARISFLDENEGVNTVRANYQPDIDRCKEMDKACKQAAVREDAALAVLNAPQKSRVPAPLGLHSARKPPSARDDPKTGRQGYGSSSHRPGLDHLGGAPQSSSRRTSGCESPMTSRRGPQGESPMTSRRNSTVPTPSPMSSRRGSTASRQRPHGAPPTPRCNSVDPRGQNAPQWPPRSPSPQRGSPSFMSMVPGPPRCNSNQIPLSPQSTSRDLQMTSRDLPMDPRMTTRDLQMTSRDRDARASSTGRLSGVHRSNSYLPASDSFGGHAGGWASARAPEAMQMPPSSRGRRSSSLAGTANHGGYGHGLPTSQSLAYNAPPASPDRRFEHHPGGSPMDSYVPVPTSPMLAARVGSRPGPNGASPEPQQIPNSIEQIRDAGLAMCARLFAPPQNMPRMLSFDPPGGQAPQQQPTGFGGVVPLGPQRMNSYDHAQPPGNSGFLPLPAPLPADPFQSYRAAEFAGSYQPLGPPSPMTHRRNSYEAGPNPFSSHNFY